MVQWEEDTSILVTKLVALVLIALTTLLGAAAAFKLKSHIGSNSLLLHASNALSVGIFVSAALAHLLPDSIEDLEQSGIVLKLFTDREFPLAYVSCIVGILIAMAVESWTLASSPDIKVAAASGQRLSHTLTVVPQQTFFDSSDCDQESHSPETRASLNPVQEPLLAEGACNEPHDHVLLQKDHIDANPALLVYQEPSDPHRGGVHHHHVSFHHGEGLVGFALAILLSFHSLIEGVALGSAASSRDSWILAIAILAHKWAEALGVTLSLVRAHVDFKLGVKVVVMYAAMTPLGIIISSFATGFLGHSTSQVVQGVMSSFTSGVFLYSGIIHSAHEDYCGTYGSLIKFVCAMLGAALMVIVSFWA
jgi:zinc transporter 1/2/3